MKKLSFLIFVLFSVPTIAFGQWQLIHTFPSAPLNMEVVDTTIYVVAGLNGLYASYDNGQTWIQQNNNISDTIISDFYADTSILMAATGQGVNISFDGGNTWTLSTNGINDPYGVFSVSKSGNNLLCGTFGTFAGDSAVLYLSTNNGNSWTPQVTITWTSGFPAFAVKDTFVVASSYSGDFYYSSDNGVSYNPVSTPFSAEDMVITNSTIVVATGGPAISSINYSLDNGLSWQIGQDTVAANDFKNNNDTVYSATLKGFYYSFDAGMNWLVYNAGLPLAKQCYAVGANGNDLWLGHQSGELYKLSLSQITSINEQQMDFGFTIFPNPVANELRIQNAELKIKEIEIYTVLGEKVFQSNLISLLPHLSVDVSQLPSGIYLVSIKANERIETLKFLKE